MPSQFFGLNIAYSGLTASNAALNTTSNNIANVETKGLRKDIKVIKNSFFASEVPYSASNFFSKNVFNLIKENGGTNFKINPEDEIFKAICLCNPIISGDR